MQTNSFHNTTHEKGTQLVLYNNKAKAQEDRILEFLRSNPDRFFPSFKINELVFGGNLGVQSLSRAMANLKNQKKIIKSNTAMFMGDQGRSVHGWMFDNNYKENNNG